MLRQKRQMKYKMKRLILTISAAALLSACCNEETVPVYRQADRPVCDRVEDLLDRMTFEEKVLQLNQYIIGLNTNVNNIGEEIKDVPGGIGSVIYFSDNVELRNELQRKAMEETRLGIPVLFGFDVIHGFRTVYPIPLAQGCSWNPELVTELCSVAAREARLSGTDWTFAPMIDVSRDGRWGRVAECFGEDPYANSVMGVASVKGYQGDDLYNTDKVAACLKHFVGYGMSQGGRDYTATDISMQSMWDTYLPPYKACIDAGAETVMSAFNDINGVPATANHLFLTEILKEKWGHKGFVVSDWNAVEQLIPQGYAADRKEAALKAFTAGVEMDMKDNCYREYFEELLNEGKITERQVDEAVARILSLKFRLGLFEKPYTEPLPESERILTADAYGAAERLAEESMVLLKNDGILPLGNPGRIAVIGPMAKDKFNIIGSWRCHGKAEDAQSIYEGLETEFGSPALNYAPGCDFDGTDRSGFALAKAAALKSDVIVLCLGEKSAWSGENASRSTLALPSIQEELAAELASTGKPMVLVLSNGRPLELNRLAPMADAVLEAWQPGMKGGSPVAGILSGRVNPSGKLCITFPWSTGQVPIFYNSRQSSRPDQGQYQEIPSGPMYEFGHGLSYSEFVYSDLKADSEDITMGRDFKVHVSVTNSSDRDGYETVLWYVTDPFCSVTRPVKELRHFEKKFIKAGATEIFTFDVNPEKDLAYVDSEGNPLLESGEYRISVNGQTLKFNLK